MLVISILFRYFLLNRNKEVERGSSVEQLLKRQYKRLLLMFPKLARSHLGMLLKSIIKGRTGIKSSI